MVVLYRRSVDLAVMPTWIVVFVAAFRVLAAAVEPDYDKDCYGTHSGLDHGTHGLSVEPDPSLLETMGERDAIALAQVQARYNLYRRMYTNCTVVNGNLEIVFLIGPNNQTYSLDFLRNIREVTGYVLIAGNAIETLGLNNLRIIRGETLFKSAGETNKPTNYSLYIGFNYHVDHLPAVGLLELQLTSLREIMAGSVFIFGNNLLCHEKSIQWHDIITGRGAVVQFVLDNGRTTPDYKRQCQECHSSCNSRCWGRGSDMCQKLNRINCPEQCGGRCYGNETYECCDVECAGGCTGPTNSDCLACKHFVDEGRCVSHCPPLKVYSTITRTMRDNPGGKYMYGRQCVKQCPPNYLAVKSAGAGAGACVSDCGSGQHADIDGNCVDNALCVGYCPKRCYLSEKIHAHNIHLVENCSIIVGPLRIQTNTFTGDLHERIPPMRMNKLRLLQNVEEITDYLLIDTNYTRLRNLNFLSNLRAVHGRHTVDGQVIRIVATRLRNLGLTSLVQLGEGDVIILGNRDLCYVDSVNWTSLRVGNKTGRTNGTIIRRNRNHAACVRDGFVCSDECTSHGCWGSDDDQCLSCRNHRHGRLCVSSCSQFRGLYQVNKSSECAQCHEQCDDVVSACTGPGANDCRTCRHFLSNVTCVARCSTTEYSDNSSVCRPCHAHCHPSAGCTGPGNGVGPGRCIDCAFATLAADQMTVVECLSPDTQECEPGYYQRPRPRKSSSRLRNVVAMACAPCHPECRTCRQSGPYECDGDCVHYVEDGRCVPVCSPSQYATDDSRCLPCDTACSNCTGPTATQCASCRHYTLFDDFPNRNSPGATFNCTKVCPGEEHRMQENGIIVCVPDEFAPRGQHILATALTIPLCVLVAGVIVVVVMVLRRQVARVQQKNLQLTAKITGVVECEPLTPGKAVPDMAVLRLIKESELRRRDVIGSGAFGTVYKGFWYPEGENVKIPVAIKVLQEGTGRDRGLLDEARIMASVLHPCCVHVLAVCLASQVMLVTPLMPLGCLLDYIRKHRDNVGSKALLNWCAQIARGMAYLESRGIIHRDLAARNVLVHTPHHVKITDFGLAKLVSGDESFQSESCKMPIKWLALECIRNRTYSHKSDVWSFGITLWELFTYGQRPYDTVRATEIVMLLEKGERLPQPSICTIDVYMIMIKCWMLDADSRPSFEELREEFAKMARDPGRYLVIPNDALLRLPSQTSAEGACLPCHGDSYPGRGSDDGPEEVITADDYVRQRLAAVSAPRPEPARASNNSPSVVRWRKRKGRREASGDKGRRQDSAEDPGQSISLLNHTRQDHDLYGYTDDASTSDGDDGAMAETVLDSPPAATPDVDGAPTALSSTSGSGSSSTRVKEPPQNAMKLPLDQTDYLQPQSSLPATYLDLVASPGDNDGTEVGTSVTAVSNPEYFCDKSDDHVTVQ